MMFLVVLSLCAVDNMYAVAKDCSCQLNVTLSAFYSSIRSEKSAASCMFARYILFSQLCSFVLIGGEPRENALLLSGYVLDSPYEQTESAQKRCPLIYPLYESGPPNEVDIAQRCAIHHPKYAIITATIWGDCSDFKSRNCHANQILNNMLMPASALELIAQLRKDIAEQSMLGLVELLSIWHFKSVHT